MIYKGNETIITQAATLAHQRNRAITIRRPTGFMTMPDGSVVMGRVIVTAAPANALPLGAQVFPLGDPIPS